MMRRMVVVQDEHGWNRVQPRPRKVRRVISARKRDFYSHRSLRKGTRSSTILRLFGSPVERRRPTADPTVILPPFSLPPLPPVSHTAPLLKSPPSFNFSLKSFKLALLNPTPLEIASDHPMASNRGKRPRTSTTPDSSLNLAPASTNPLRHGRCFLCSQPGHTKATCPERGAFCTLCRKPGHDAKVCRKVVKPVSAPAVQAAKALSDSLQPRGCLDEKDFPVGRPEAVTVFVPQGPENLREIQHLSSAVVIDAWLRENLDHDAVQATVMTVCQLDNSLQFIHSSDSTYILLLPKGWERAKFIRAFAPQLELLGLVIYPWSPAIDAEPCEYTFKVWLDLYKVPIHAWDTSYLVPLVSQFGLLLDHTPLEKVRSLNTLRVVLAVRSLLDVPKLIFLIVKGLKWKINIKVIGWDNDPTLIRLPVDPTPPLEYFLKVQEKLSLSFRQMQQAQPNDNMVPVGFDVLYEVWSGLMPSDDKDRLEAKLKSSIFWEIRQNEQLLKELHSGQNSDSKLKKQLVNSKDFSVEFPTENLHISQEQAESNVVANRSSVGPTILLQAGALEALSIDARPSQTKEGAKVAGVAAKTKQNVADSTSVHKLNDAVNLEVKASGNKEGKQVANSEPSCNILGKMRAKPKPGVTASKKAIEDAIAAAGLARCFDEAAFAEEATMSEEEGQIMDVCGVLATQQVQLSAAETEAQGDGGDDNNIAFTDLEIEGNEVELGLDEFNGLEEEAGSKN